MGVADDGAGNVWASGGSRNRVWQFRSLAPVPAAVGTRHVGIFPGSPNRGIKVVGYPGNMVLGHGKSSAGKLFVVGNLSIPETAFGGKCPNGAPDLDPHAVPPVFPICSVINVIDVTKPDADSPSTSFIPVGRDAYGIAISKDGSKLYVSNWADDTNPRRANGAGTVSVVDVTTGAEIQVVPVGHHPTGLTISPDGTRVAVTNSADDSVSVLSLSSDNSGLVGSVFTTSVKTVSTAPRGATPLAVAFDPTGSHLYVALAGENAVEVLTGSGTPIQETLKGITVPHTYIPTGWYPSALATSPDPAGGTATSRLYVTNLKGIGAGPGPNGQAEPLSGSRTQGTVSAIDVDPGQFATWTQTVVDNNNWRALFANTAAHTCAGDHNGPLCQATDPNFRSQLHAIFIVKENKTFDQYFGDVKALVPDADADPTWLLYGMPVTTNQHLLARQYSLSDEFWADSEQSTTGHKWTSAGYATEHDEITWNTEYDQGLRGDRSDGQYDGQFTGPKNQDIANQEDAIDRPATRLVDSTEAAGISTRVYSDDVNPGSLVLTRGDRIPQEAWGIEQSNNHHGRDLDFPDNDRASIFLHGVTVSHEWSADKPGTLTTFGSTIELSDSDKAKFTLDGWTAAYNSCFRNGGTDAACQKAMPQYLYVALPVDHTLGFNPLSPTPASMVADNDYAVGRIVESLSKSPFWKDTVVFITEDDTQASGDHVDSHRTFLLTTGGLVGGGTLLVMKNAVGDSTAV
jgi:YVTN family beta-propeller protein